MRDEENIRQKCSDVNVSQFLRVSATLEIKLAKKIAENARRQGKQQQRSLVIFLMTAKSKHSVFADFEDSHISPEAFIKK